MPKIWLFEKVSCLVPVLLTLLAFPIYAQDAEQVSKKATSSSATSSSHVPADLLIRQILESIDKDEFKPADTLADELARGGDEAVAAIQDYLRKQAIMRAMLIRALGHNRSDASTDVLLQRAYLESNNTKQLLARLTGRSINRRLSEKELQNWISWINSDDGGQAGMAARFLSKCSFNDVEERAKPIVTRFVQELVVQKAATLQQGKKVAERDKEETGLANETEARLGRLGEFLLAFSNFNDPKVVALLQQQAKEGTDPAVLFWLTIALGFAGDDSVAAKLKNIVTQERDASTKAVALRAYCRAAKFTALPLLRVIMIEHIKTQGAGSRNVLMMTAESELFRLRSLPGFPATIPAETR